MKTTTARNGWTFDIHGHDQLEAPVSNNLYFAAIKLQKDPGGKLSLPSLIGDIEKLGVNLVDFAGKLLDVGYNPGEAMLYSGMHYNLQAIRVYRVDTDFPKLVSASFLHAMVPIGVQNIRFTINLDGALPAQLDQSCVEKLQQELAQTL